MTLRSIIDAGLQHCISVQFIAGMQQCCTYQRCNALAATVQSRSRIHTKTAMNCNCNVAHHCMGFYLSVDNSRSTVFH
jgi:hypothetical protein